MTPTEAALEAPKKCPACRHHLHKSECEVPLPWWRRWILPTCRCIYWDARWDQPTHDDAKEPA